MDLGCTSLSMIDRAQSHGRLTRELPGTV